MIVHDCVVLWKSKVSYCVNECSFFKFEGICKKSKCPPQNVPLSNSRFCMWNPIDLYFHNENDDYDQATFQIQKKRSFAIIIKEE